MTLMKKEIAEAAAVVRRQQDDPSLANTRSMLTAKSPDMLMTLARGTSDHAAEYLGYLLMRYSGIPVASIPLSLNTLYQAPWRQTNNMALTISQSGGSQDLLEGAKRLQQAGIPVLALLNTVPSPLSDVCPHVVNIGAGREQSVAATKSFIASITAGIRVMADWLQQDDLLPALDALPDKLDAAQALDWSPAVEQLRDAKRLYVIGRGTGLPIAKEAALKCKETCLLQGEAFSGAEVKHGPMALVNEQQHILILAPPDETQAGLLELAAQFRKMGGNVLLAADDKVSERDLPLIDAGHSALQGITSIQSFYSMAESLSRARGIDTDNPPNLNKVTTTL
ncbi:SIS domain-containing protein [Cardiobacteriaceae bacterium TAE3-ERU3]|nr:SIS domain-containing protein [Cardiobacteriaceae bacterium TAE3-ERU3]